MSKQAARWAAGPNGRSDITGRVDVLELCGLRSSSTDQRQQRAHMQAQHIMSVADERATRTFRLMLCMATSIATGWPIFADGQHSKHSNWTLRLPARVWRLKVHLELSAILKGQRA